jgi:hypothetical protein
VILQLVSGIGKSENIEVAWFSITSLDRETSNFKMDLLIYCFHAYTFLVWRCGIRFRIHLGSLPFPVLDFLVEFLLRLVFHLKNFAKSHNLGAIVAEILVHTLRFRMLASFPHARVFPTKLAPVAVHGFLASP